MWEYELEKQNLLMAIKLGVIDWFQFFEGWRKLTCTPEAEASSRRDKQTQSAAS